MVDYIIRGMAKNNEIRFFAGYTKYLCEKARKIHETAPTASAALGRLLTAGALMGAMCKNDDDLITLQIECDGPIGGMTVTSDAKSNVKGFVKNPKADLPPNYLGKLDVGACVNYGTLSVIKDIGLDKPYIGQTNLTTGEIGDDLTYYFATSEQIPTSVGVGVLVDTDISIKEAGGFIVQLMPFASDETIDMLERNINNLKPITTLLNEGKTIEDIVNLLFTDMDVTITDKLPTRYKCNCNRDRVKKALCSIGRKDIQEMVDDGEPITLNCHFCNTNYTFPIDELKEILANK